LLAKNVQISPARNFAYGGLTCGNLPDNVFGKWIKARIMLELIEHLLILQDRDRKVLKTRAELANVDPQRRMLQGKLSNSQANAEGAKLRLRQIEAERKKLELEVEAKKQQIEKYSLQQFQTKKNEEYRALTHEIDLCKEAIFKIEDQQLELMEQGEEVQKKASAASQAANELKKEVENQISQLTSRQENLTKELAELESNRDQLAAGIEQQALLRYERLLEHKGQNVVVGIDHGVCGGCHMRLSRQTVVSCQAEQDIVNCPNCGRILYYTREMNLAVAE